MKKNWIGVNSKIVSIEGLQSRAVQQRSFFREVLFEAGLRLFASRVVRTNTVFFTVFEKKKDSGVVCMTRPPAKLSFNKIDSELTNTSSQSSHVW